MDNVKNDAYYVKKITDDLAFIMKNTNSVSFEEFTANEILIDSMLFRLIQVSESSLKLTDGFKESVPTIPWQAVKGLRNKIVHEYGNVDFKIIFNTVKTDVPFLYNILIHSI